MGRYDRELYLKGSKGLGTKLNCFDCEYHDHIIKEYTLDKMNCNHPLGGFKTVCQLVNFIVSPVAVVPKECPLFKKLFKMKDGMCYYVGEVD